MDSVKHRFLHAERQAEELPSESPDVLDHAKAAPPSIQAGSSPEGDAELLHADMLRGPAQRAARRTRQWLLDRQADDGSWCAELQGDTILESETILLLAFLGREDSDLARRSAKYLMEEQLPEGGWAMYPGGALEVSGSVKAYFALKLVGHDPDAEYMRRARSAILARGGADVVNSFTRFYLALLGQIPYEQCPAVPPEAVLLPKWFPINLYSVSSWSRTMIVPLSIISAKQPVRRIEPRRGIRELFVKEPEDWAELRCPGLKGGTGFFSWDRFFRTADRWLKWYQKHPLRSLRRKGLEAAERWMIRRFDGSDGLGAIYPPMVWSIIALKCLGYPDDSPELRYCRRQLEGLVLDDEASPDGDIGDDVQGSLRIQPCKSPVWDTAIAVRVLAASGVGPGHPALAKANHWLLSKQIRRPGDWAETVRAEPGGWCFEYANDFYPDSDDTAMVLMALQSQFAAGPAEPESSPCDAALPQNALPQDAGEAAMRDNGLGQLGSTSRCNVPSPHLDATRLGRHPIDASQGSREASQAGDRAVSDHAVSDHTVAEQAAIDAMQNTVEAIDRGMRWMVAMQNRDGGWGAFDRNNDREFLCHVPFADHNAMIDPSTPDLTGRVLESLGRLGERVGKPEVDRAVAYLRREQMPDGSWFGRWGVNYVYGTWQTVVGLTAVGVPANDPAVAAGVQWLLDHQQACGAWGESPDTYEFPHLCGRGTPTASQTAWGMMGLMAAGLHHHPAVLRAVRYLLLTQKEDGAWDEKEFTGTGFPRVFYLRYHYYRIYFPLLALSQWLAATQANAMSPSPLSADLRETSTAKRG